MGASSISIMKEGEASATGEASASGKASVTGEASIRGEASVMGEVSVDPRGEVSLASVREVRVRSAVEVG